MILLAFESTNRQSEIFNFRIKWS